MNDDMLKVSVYLSVALDGVPPVRCANEMKLLQETFKSVGVRAHLDAIWPPNVEAIGFQSENNVLHVSSHASEAGLELQNESGVSVLYPPERLVEAIGDHWKLVVLNGCDTSRAGEAINVALSCNVVCTAGYVSDSAAESFTKLFYRHLSLGRSLDESFRRASEHVRANMQADYQLLPGNSYAWSVEPGQLEVNDRFRAAVVAAWSILRISASRRSLLTMVHAGLNSASRACIVHGPPRSGVSVFLAAAGDYFGGIVASATHFYDCSTKIAPEEIARWLTEPSSLVIINNIDEANHETQQIVRRTLSTRAFENARIIIGARGPLPTLEAAAVPLTPLLRSEAEFWLQEAVGEAWPKWAWALDVMELWPGRLQALLRHIEGGADKDEVERLLVQGNPDSDLKPVVDGVWASPAQRTALLCISLFPNAPRPLIKNAWMAALPKASNAAEDQFAVTVAILARRGLIRSSEYVTQRGSVRTHLFLEPDASAVINRKRIGRLTPDQHSRVRSVALQWLEDVDAGGELDGNADWLWLSELLMLCKEAGRNAEHALDLVFPHLDRGGDMLRSGDARKLALIAGSAFAVAKQIGSWDRAAVLALANGQMRYRAGDLIAAEGEFRRVLRLPSSASRKLQAHRALGQVAYRRADYRGALRHYESGVGFADEAESYVVTTLLQEQGKALSRLGRAPEAIALLRQVLNRRNDEAGVREVAKAQHELARALLRIDELPEARELFESARNGALSAGDEKWALGPLYHLLLIELESPDSARARARLTALESEATRLGEQLWITFSVLGRAMLLFAVGQFDASRKNFERALVEAEKFGYSQVSEDAREWTRRRCMRAINAADPSASTDALAEVLATTESIPTGKALKALRYSSSPSTIRSVQVEIASDHEARQLKWSTGPGWTCTCDLFGERGRCSHVTTVLLRGIAPIS